jgi:hypothetical protein
MSKSGSVHEDFARPDDTKIGSERGFGFVFSAVCAAIAGYLLWKSSTAFWGWMLAATIFACLAALFPRALRPLNVLWFKFGLLLHHIITPIVLALMFYTVFTPMGFLMRLMGKRPLNLAFDERAQSYWIFRKPPGPPRGSFKNQF